MVYFKKILKKKKKTHTPLMCVCVCLQIWQRETKDKITRSMQSQKESPPQKCCFIKHTWWCFSPLHQISYWETVHIFTSWDISASFTRLFLIYIFVATGIFQKEKNLTFLKCLIYMLVSRLGINICVIPRRITPSSAINLVNIF